MKDIQNAVAVYLQAETDIRAVADRTRCREYPVLAVAVEQNGAVLLHGGKLADCAYTVRVTAISDRERSGETQLISALCAPLLRGIPAVLDGQQRTLHPLCIRTEGEEVRFDLSICRPVPAPQGGEAGAEDTMETLHVSM